MNMRAVVVWLGAGGVVVALTVLATWPQIQHLDTAFVSHQDPYFSTWRVAWIAHALITNPAHLFDANVFHPTTDTLAFSDATLLEGLIAAPLFWAHLPPVLIYNLLLFAGFAGSGLAMFLLARSITHAIGPAFVAAAVFVLAPYRIEHVMHLELQWAMWIPLAFWALTRAADTNARVDGVIAGLFVWLQILSCVYYGAFLGLTLLIFVPVLLLTRPSGALRAVPVMLIAAVTAIVLTIPYLWPYLQASRTVGARDLAEVARYSAQPINYLSASYQNWLWGWTADRWGGPEVRLYPGIVAVALAVVAFAHRNRRSLLLYWLVLILSVVMSFGVHGTIYRWLVDHVSALQGLRAPARFAILGSAGLAVLAAMGAQVLMERGGSNWRRGALALVFVLLAVDYANRPLALTSLDLTTTAPVYKVIASAGPGVIAEFPVPSPALLPGPDPYYSAWSISHWHPLLNGYSGYHPPDYLRTLARLRSFPDESSIARLRERDVRYVVIHEALYEREQYTRLMLQMASRSELKPWGRYKDPIGSADLFVLDK